jgi:hypothetical protein
VTHSRRGAARDGLRPRKRLPSPIYPARVLQAGTLVAARRAPCCAPDDVARGVLAVALDDRGKPDRSHASAAVAREPSPIDVGRELTNRRHRSWLGLLRTLPLRHVLAGRSLDAHLACPCRLGSHRLCGPAYFISHVCGGKAVAHLRYQPHSPDLSPFFSHRLERRSLAGFSRQPVCS